MRTSFKALAHTSLALCLASGCGEVATTVSESDKLSSTVRAELVRLRGAHSIPGVAMGLIHEGRIRTFSAGTLGVGDVRPVSDGTIFEVGSVSKLYTGLLAATAQVDARISLHDRPGRHIPWLRGTALDSATLDQLGTYTAGGLPLQFPDGVRDDASLRGYLTRWRPSTPPNEARLYSNPSIGLLGVAVAASYGVAYPEALRKYVLTPLRLDETFIEVPGALQDHYSWGVSAQTDRARVSPGPLDAQAYGVKTTVRDLTRFVASWLKPEISDSLMETLRPRYSVGRVMQQGLGWEGVVGSELQDSARSANSNAIAYESRSIEPPVGEACVLNKTGSTSGFSAYVVIHRKSQSGVVLLANRNIPIVDRVSAALSVLAAATKLSCS